MTTVVLKYNKTFYTYKISNTHFFNLDIVNCVVSSNFRVKLSKETETEAKLDYKTEAELSN